MAHAAAAAVMRGVMARALVLLLATTALLAGGIFLEGRLSGWAGLADQFRAPEGANGLGVTVREGGIGDPRWFHGVAPLQVSLGLGGLRLSYPFPYSIGHPPLQIPWRQLRVLDARVDEAGSALLLSVSLPERARISLRGDLASVIGEWLAPARR